MNRVLRRLWERVTPEQPTMRVRAAGRLAAGRLAAGRLAAGRLAAGRLAAGRRVAIGRIVGAGLVASAVSLGGLPADAALGHSADPGLGGNGWSPGQTIPYTWASGQVPPGWLQDAFNAAANQSNWTRYTHNPQLRLQSGASSLVAYGEPTGCSPAGIACFSRNAPYTFRVWYRTHGYWFDWGQLLWCQGPSGPVDGCFDAWNIGLDELGHVQGLDHHANWSDASDYADAVVQTVSRSKPRSGWDAHAFGRCDLARLQLLYDRFRMSDLVSTCLSIPSTLALSASAGSALSGTSVLFSATLRTGSSSSYGALSDDPVSSRTVYLQRRFPGSSSWTTVTTMAPQANDGGYASTVAITGTYEYRATFPKLASEGLGGSTSSGVTVSMISCRVCGNAVTRDPAR